MYAMQTVTAATISGALVFGMALALLGRFKSAAAQPESMKNSSLRRWLLALNVALAPLVLLSGILLDLFGARLILVGGSVTLAVALVIFASPQRQQGTPLPALRASKGKAAAMLLAGLGGAALAVASIVLMPNVFFVSEEISAGLNLGFVFIALGALLASALADILLQRLGLRRTLTLFALMALMPAFLGVLPSSAWRIAEHSGTSSELFVDPACWLAALALFFYVPLEAAVSLWTIRLLAERGQEEREATSLLSGFWTAFLASRLLTALGQHSIFYSEWWDKGLIVAAPLVAAVVLGNMAGAGQRGRPHVGLILLGLLLGPVLPTLLSFLFQAVPEAKGMAFGLVFAAGSLGSALLWPFITLRSPILLALLVAVFALMLGLTVT